MQTIRILTVVLVAAVIIMSCGEQLSQRPSEAPFFTTFAEGLQAAADGKHVLVDFYTDW